MSWFGLDLAYKVNPGMYYTVMIEENPIMLVILSLLAVIVL